MVKRISEKRTSKWKLMFSISCKLPGFFDDVPRCFKRICLKYVVHEGFELMMKMQNLSVKYVV